MQVVNALLARPGTAGKNRVNTVCDPACGSLPLKAAKTPGRDGGRFGCFGQEIHITTYNLCRA